ncbi:MAG: hypothetical protein ACI9EW_000741 [Cellvibrionaceae bacterium]|jgi:hypothetical protein
MNLTAIKNHPSLSQVTRLMVAVLAILLVIFTPLTAYAQDDTQKKQAQLLTPPNKTGVTEVFVDVGISEIFAINERDETYDVDAYMFLSWNDNRLAFDPDEFGYEKKVYQDEAALEILKSEIWAPSINIIDARGSRDRMSTSLTVYFDGQVDYSERFKATIEQGFDLGDFPFDEQGISFTIEPYVYGIDEVIFLPFDELLTDEWETEEWGIQYHPLIVDSSGEESFYAFATASLTLIRIPNFYVTSFILPLLLIVTLSWAVFWMEHNINLAERLSISFTSVLTVVAFDFLSTDSLPKLSYPTILDQILTVSYIFLALTIVENVVSASFVRRENDLAAQRVDRTSRWLFPLAYYVTLAAVLVVALGTGVE